MPLEVITSATTPASVQAAAPAQTLPEQAFLRTTGTPLIPGNGLRILKDSTENYPAWLEAIHASRRKIYFENYIIGNDEVGQQFLDALVERARAGIMVRVIYDWLGTHVPNRFWRPLLAAGGEVRRFNPPRLDSPFGWLSRDHRKSISVDGRVAFISGLCVSRQWIGNPARGIEPWRDTGVELQGPAVADAELAFAQVWKQIGAPIAEDELTRAQQIPPAGDVPVSVVASSPTLAALYRLDQLIAAAARRTLWLTDAYFVGVAPYVQALRAAAQDGVDVRLLVPGSSDISLLSPITRAGYRPLLEAGVRIFEYGPGMTHVKALLVDDLWSVIGTTNVDNRSFEHNDEVNVAIRDHHVAARLTADFLADRERSKEITLAAWCHRPVWEKLIGSVAWILERQQ